MTRKDKSRTLQEQYLEILKGSPSPLEPVPYDLGWEEPYAGRIVQTVTTYSVSEKPELIQE